VRSRKIEEGNITNFHHKKKILNRNIIEFIDPISGVTKSSILRRFGIFGSHYWIGRTMQKQC
jgi:hypothetical protein